jgi:CheY-like chemotaxis protein
MIRILMMDDAELSHLLHDSFFARSEVDTRIAATSAEILRLAEDQVPDWLILDSRAASPDAIAVCHHFAEQQTTREVPIWIVGEPADEADAREAGAVGFIPRPLDRRRVIDSFAEKFPGLLRSSPRRPARLKVEFFRDDQSAVGYTRDISAYGTFLRTRDGAEIGDDVQLIFSLPGTGAKTIRANSRVVRTLPPEGDAFQMSGAGLSFTNIGARDRLELSRFVEAGRGD